MSKKKILLVDDEERILRSLTKILAGWAAKNYVELLTAPYDIKALEILKIKYKYINLIVSNLRTSKLGGCDFLLKVKNLYPDIMSILLTGFSGVQEMMKAIKAGVFSYILKPWDNHYLIAEIQKTFDIYNLRESIHR